MNVYLQEGLRGISLFLFSNNRNVIKKGELTYLSEIELEDLLNAKSFSTHSLGVKIEIFIFVKNFNDTRPFMKETLAKWRNVAGTLGLSLR